MSRLAKVEEQARGAETHRPRRTASGILPEDSGIGDIESAIDRRISVDETGRTVIRRKVDQERSIAVFGKVLNTMHLGVTITDTGGKLIFTNLAMARMHGWTIEELLGRDVRIFFSAPLRGSLTPDRMNGPGTVREHLSVRKDGSEFPISFYSDVIEGAPGQPIGIVTTWEDISERKRAEEELRHASLHDRLTQLPNQTLFLDRLNLALAHVRRNPESLSAMLFLDVDRFKMINDSAGHMVGDELLVGIVRRLGTCFREVDTFARFGGDEFTVLLDQVDSPEMAVMVADRIRREMAAPFSIAGEEVFVSVSIGIAMVSSAYERAEDVLRDADTAMYRSKDKGRGGYQVFDLEMHEHAVSLLRVESELRRAVDRGELQLQFQPIIDLDDGRIESFEALIRWKHPTRGLLSPDSFIPIAEECGLVLALDRWVLAAACRRLDAWNRSLPAGTSVSVAVNLSAQQFLDPTLVDEVTRALATASVDPSLLQIEITETAVMKNPELAASIVARLRRLGIKIHIDDFGTGYSSFNHLLRLSVDSLKIDRSFTACIDSHKEGLEIVRAIVTLGKNLGMRVITEGIETERQHATLRDLGCPSGQGYWLSPPLDADAADSLVAGGTLTCAMARRHATGPAPAPGPAPAVFDVNRTQRFAFSTRASHGEYRQQVGPA
ncbi:MAG: putative bifunctional diguanylate cyclase/phosphodiesterase [Thermoanaerobaculia bacterium]